MKFNFLIENLAESTRKLVEKFEVDQLKKNEKTKPHLLSDINKRHRLTACFFLFVKHQKKISIEAKSELTTILITKQ